MWSGGAVEEVAPGGGVDFQVVASGGGAEGDGAVVDAGEDFGAEDFLRCAGGCGLALVEEEDLGSGFECRNTSPGP